VLSTDRLVLRRWRPEDRTPFAALNADPAVMEHFPAVLGRAESDSFAARIETGLRERGWGLWAVQPRAGGEMVGFIGLNPVPAELPFAPAVEVGWRLARSHWGQGLATEGARAAIAFGFGELRLDEIVSFTAVTNARSRRVMERLGMTRDARGDFLHPAIVAGSELAPHILYRLEAPRGAP
jgi:RimJ/RimL family protein N-acetyltransferase